MDHQAVTTLVATTRTDTIVATGTYGGFIATMLNWLGANQSGLTVLVMVCTCAVTCVAAFYGMYHKYRIRKIAATQGFYSLRKSDQNIYED